MNALCFYSKYSVESKRLLDMAKALSLKYICIDNSLIRKKLANSKKIVIQYVPCILLLYDTGIIEKYEGNHAFRWIKEQIPSPKNESYKQEYVNKETNSQKKSTKTKINSLKKEPQEKIQKVVIEKASDKIIQKASDDNKSMAITDIALQLQKGRETLTRDNLKKRK